MTAGPADLSCAVQVGGESRRFGRDKAILVVRGRTLTERVVTTLRGVSDDVMIVGNRLDRFERLPCRLIEDEIAHGGALGGIYTSLLHARHPYVFVAGCDMPLLNPRLVSFLHSLAPGYDVVMPYLRQMPEPMHAVYGKAALTAIRRIVDKGNARIIEFLAEVRVRAVAEEELRTADPDLQSFFNLNNERDLADLEQILERRSGASS
jgi:molybdopterin-guanine dinucleotide biosynthesis protein A